RPSPVEPASSVTHSSRTKICRPPVLRGDRYLEEVDVKPLLGCLPRSQGGDSRSQSRRVRNLVAVQVEVVAAGPVVVELKDVHRGGDVAELPAAYRDRLYFRSVRSVVTQLLGSETVPIKRRIAEHRVVVGPDEKETGPFGEESALNPIEIDRGGP